MLGSILLSTRLAGIFCLLSVALFIIVLPQTFFSATPMDNLSTIDPMLLSGNLFLLPFVALLSFRLLYLHSKNYFTSHLKTFYALNVIAGCILLLLCMLAQMSRTANEFGIYTSPDTTAEILFSSFGFYFAGMSLGALNHPPFPKLLAIVGIFVGFCWAILCIAPAMQYYGASRNTYFTELGRSAVILWFGSVLVWIAGLGLWLTFRKTPADEAKPSPVIH